MRTSLDIPDDLFRKLKIHAAQEGVTLREIALRGIRREMEQPEEKPARRLKKPILKSYAPASIDIDNEQIYDTIGFP